MNIFRIYKFTYFLWIIVFFYLAIITIFAQSFQLDKVLITVDKETITQNELLLIYEQIEAEIGNKLLPEEKARLINDLILELLLLVEAKRFRVNVDPTEVNQYLLNFQKINQLSSKDLEQLLKDRGQDIRYFRREIKKKKIGEIMLRRVQASIKVNDEEIEQLYQEKYPPKIFYQIRFLVNNKNTEELLRIRETAIQNNNFGDLILKYSDDPYVSQNKGELPPTTIEDMLVEFTEIVKTLKSKEISKPIITDKGHYLIQLIKKNKNPKFKLDDVILEIKEEIYNKKYQPTLDAYINSLHKKYLVVIKDPKIYQLLEQFGYKFS